MTNRKTKKSKPENKKSKAGKLQTSETIKFENFETQKIRNWKHKIQKAKT